MKLREEKTLVLVKPDGVKRGLVGEIVKRIEQRLYKELHVQIFLMLVAGVSVEDIAQELNYTPSHINNIRHKFIWPAVKEAMDISDTQYDRLVSSGRIYCNY